MKNRVSVFFLSFLLVVSLMQCFAAAEKQTDMEENVSVMRNSEHKRSQLASMIPSYIGGLDDDEVSAVVLEGEDIVYIGGSTASTNFPIVNGYQDTNAGYSDCFIIKMNITSNTIIYSTYLGGNQSDRLKDIALDDAGNVYGTGTTSSYDFPTVNPYQEHKTYAEQYVDLDAFVFKLNSNGDELLYSTYFGSDFDEFACTIDVDNEGNAHVGGAKFGAGPLPIIVNAFDQTRHFDEGFLFKLNSTGNGVEYSTYVGGYEDDIVVSVAVDDSGNTYLAGWTSSDDFPELNGYDESFNGQKDCFVAKVNSTGTGVLYSTYVGGSGLDELTSMSVDSSGIVYATGTTASSDFPSQNAYSDSLNGFMDCFVFKLSQDAESLLYSSYIGGSDVDYSIGVEYDSSGAAYITGYTKSEDYPLVNAFDTSFSGLTEAFVSKFNTTTNALEYSSYLGGSGEDKAIGIAISSNGNIIVAGHTLSEDFPTIDETHNGAFDCFAIIIPTQAPIDFPMIFVLVMVFGVAGVIIIAAVVLSRRR